MVYQAYFKLKIADSTIFNGEKILRELKKQEMNQFELKTIF